MKINKINYVSAVYFSALFFSLYLIMGIIQLSAERMNPGTFAALGLAAPTFLISILYAPVIGGISGYVFALLMILIYNVVAKKYPFTFVAKK